MDFLKNLAANAGGNKDDKKNESGSSSGGIMGHVNNALGGGQAGEKKEGAFPSLIPPSRCILTTSHPLPLDALDKG